MATLEQKQAYYSYGPSGWTYKQPPTLAPYLHRELERIGGGRDMYGDPYYRFLWGGIALIRQSPVYQRPTIRGDWAATKVNKHSRQLQPRYLFARARQPKNLCFQSRKGRVVRVGRLDQIPKGIFSWWEYEYVEYGKLYWYIERKLTPEQLVEAGIYDEGDPAIPARGDYIFMLQIETPDEQYYEPDHSWLESVAKHVFELQTIPLDELRRMDMDRREAANAAKERKEEEEEDAALEDIIIRAQRAAAANAKHFFTRMDNQNR